jgi:signal peptidase II
LTRLAAAAWGKTGAIVLAVLALDQLTKRLVEDSIVPGEEHGVLPGVALVNTRNRGVAFGFLPGRHTVVTVLVIVALVVLATYFARNHARRLIWLPTGMILGGALGNIVDRLRIGSVTDFVKLPLGWPPFNLADTAITLGVVALLLVIEGPNRGREQARGDAQAGTAADRRGPPADPGREREP